MSDWPTIRQQLLQRSSEDEEEERPQHKPVDLGPPDIGVPRVAQPPQPTMSQQPEDATIDHGPKDLAPPPAWYPGHRETDPQMAAPGFIDEAMRDILTYFDDPRGRQAQSTIATLLDELYGIDPQFTMDHYDTVMKDVLGRSGPPHTLLKEIRNYHQMGQESIERGDLYWLIMLNRATPETHARIQQIDQGWADMEEWYHGLAPFMLKQGARIAPYLERQLIEGSKEALVWGGAAALATLLLATKPVSAPIAAGVGIAGALGIGGAATVPSAFMAMAKAGRLWGGLRAMATSAAGNSYASFVTDPRLEGVPNELKLIAASTIGAFTAGIEQLKLKAVPGLGDAIKYIDQFTMNAVRKFAVSEVPVAIIRRAAGRLVSGVAENVAEEMLEQVSQHVAQELLAYLGAEYRGEGYQTEWDRIGGELWEGFLAVTAGMTTIGLIGASGMATQQTIQHAIQIQANKKAETANADLARRIARDLTDPDVTRVIDERAPTEQEAQRAAETRRAEMTPEQQAQAQQEAEQAQAAEGERAPVPTRTEVIETTAQGRTEVMVVGDPQTEQRTGYVVYDIAGDVLTIQQVISEGTPARELVLEVAKQHRNMQIEWSPIESAEVSADESMVELRKTLIEQNPRGPDAGLQWYDPSATAQEFVTQIARSLDLSPADAGRFAKLLEMLAEGRTQDGYATTPDQLADMLVRPGQMVEAAPEVDPTQAQGRTRFVDAAGKTVDPQKVHRMRDQVRAVFASIESGDLHTASHELFHAYEALAATPGQQQALEKAVGKPRAEWDATDMEFLADGFEDYLASGLAPTPELASVFQQIADIFWNLLSYLRHHGIRDPQQAGEARAQVEQNMLLSPELTEAYDRLFTSRQRQKMDAAPVATQAELTQAVIDTTVAPEIHPAPSNPTATSFEPSSVAVLQNQIRVADVVVGQSIHQFKEGADKRGVVTPLQSDHYITTPANPIILFEHNDGTLEVATGRHRLDLLNRLGIEFIPFAQVLREADGYTPAGMMALDAETNIREKAGTVRDYANYFRYSDIDEQRASSEGLLDSHAGREGFAIGKYATDGVYTAWRNDQITTTKAAAIASAAPDNQALQDEGLRKAGGLSADELTNYVRLIAATTRHAGEIEQGDLFGRDDSVMLEQERLSKAAAQVQRELRSEYSALQSAVRLGKGAKAEVVSQYGFQPGDTESMRNRMATLETEIESWTDWYMDSDKHQQLRDRMEGRGEPAGPLLMENQDDETPGLFHKAAEEPRVMAEIALRFFGETKDPREAGYILDNGKMLDFSGRKFDKELYDARGRRRPGVEDPHIGRRDMDHADIYKAKELKLRGRTFQNHIHNFLSRSHAVRVDAINGNVMMASELSDRAINATVRAMKDVPNSVYVEWMDGIGRSVKDRQFVKLTGAAVRQVVKEGARESARLSGLLHETGDLWQLKSAEVIKEKMRGPMPAHQVRNMLENAGVKKEELFWMGLDDFLVGNKKVSPGEVLQVIENRQPVVEDVWQGDPWVLYQRTAEQEARMLDEEVVLDTRINTLLREERIVRFGEQRDLVIADQLREEIRELTPQRDAIRDERREMRQRVAMMTGMPRAKYPLYNTPGGSGYTEHLMILKDPMGDRLQQAVFRSPHWQGVDNVLVNTRLQQLDTDLGKTLLIDEIQSDWHHSGQERGYVGEAQDFRLEESRIQHKTYEDGTEVYAYQIQPHEYRKSALLPEAPPAPFRQMDQWAGLAFKRMLKVAAEAGMDAVAWTTGRQQAERYDLRSVVDQIHVDIDTTERPVSAMVRIDRLANTYTVLYRPLARRQFWTPDTGYSRLDMAQSRAEQVLVEQAYKAATIGRPQPYTVKAYRKGGEVLASKYDADQLPAVIGRGLAERVIAAREAGETSADFSGDELGVGGHGHETLYDVVLPSIAKKIGKKFGVRAGEARQFKPHESAAILRIERTIDGYHILYEMGDGSEKLGRPFPTRAEAEVVVSEFLGARERRLAATTFHAIPLPQSLKDSINKGQYLFHDADRWAGEFMYGTSVDEQVWSQYQNQSLEFQTFEDYAAAVHAAHQQYEFNDMDTQQVDKFLQAVWDSTHEPPRTAQRKIPLPDLPERTDYDHREKLDIARDIVDDAELARRVEDGEISPAEIDAMLEQAEAQRQQALDESRRADREGRGERAGLQEQEQQLFDLTDQVEAQMQRAQSAAEGSDARTQAETRLKTLVQRFRAALFENLDLAEELMQEALFVKALVMDQDAPDAVGKLGEGFQEAAQLGRDLQKAIDDKRLKSAMQQRTEQYRESRARIYAKKRQDIARAKEQVRETYRRREAARKLKEYERKLAKAIMRPPGTGVEFYGYAETIRQIQHGADPMSRGGRTEAQREQLATFLRNNPGAAPYLSQEWMDGIYAAETLTISQMEQAMEIINRLRKEGTAERSRALQVIRDWREYQRGRLANAALRGDDPRKASGAERKTPTIIRAWLQTLKPDRVADHLDNADDGPWRHWLQDRVNESWHYYVNAVEQRVLAGQEKMKELRLTFDPADLRRIKGWSYLGRELDINGYRQSDGTTPRAQEAMYWYIGINNERTRDALLYGNNIPENVMAAGIAMLTDAEREMADYIAADFNRSFPALRQAYIAWANQDLPAEEFYVPMERFNRAYENRDEVILDDLGGRAGVKKQYISRAPTYERIDMKPENQLPLRTDLIGVWQRSIKISEGFIHQGEMIRDMHAVLESRQVQDAVRQRHGQEFNRWIKRYTNDLVQAESYRAMGWAESASRVMRAHAAIAFLGGNITTVFKQFTGPMNYFADAGPMWIAGGALQLLGGNVKSWMTGDGLNHNALIQFVNDRTEARHRFISQEFEDVRMLGGTIYESLVKKVGQTSMLGLRAVDHATIYMGWKGVYDKTMFTTHGDEMAAIRAADRSVVRTQPSARVQDMAQIYREGEVMKWFTMFTSELITFWNRMTYDIPVAIKRGHYVKSMVDLSALALVGVGIGIASGALLKDDKEEWLKKYTIAQFIDSIPFIGSELSNILLFKRFHDQGVRLFPQVQYLGNSVAEMIKQSDRLREGDEADWERAVEQAARGLMMSAGLPMTTAARTYRAIRDEDAKALLGWR